jgi:hypothetical protein
MVISCAGLIKTAPLEKNSKISIRSINGTGGEIKRVCIYNYSNYRSLFWFHAHRHGYSTSHCTSHMLELPDSVIFQHIHRLCIPSWFLPLMKDPGFKANSTVN